MHSPALDLTVEDALDEPSVSDLAAISPRRGRKTLLVAGVVSLIALAPVTGDVYASLGHASRANSLWVLVATLCIASGFISSWALLRLTLRVDRWSDVAAPQLAGNAASNVLPAGSAIGAVVQLRMLRRNGVDLTRAATALAILGLLSTIAGLLVFPLVIVVPVGDGAGADLASVARLGAIALVVCVPLAIVLLRSDRPMKAVAHGCHATIRRIPHCRPPADLADRIVDERDAIRDALWQHKSLTVVTSIARALGDYFALYASMLAVGLRPTPGVVLVAFITANAAGMIPITPGGLGFVEAGLTGAIVVSGGQADQALAAVGIYRLVSCWLPVACGVAAYFWAARSATVPSVTRTRSAGVIANTCRGVPAAAQSVP